MDGQFEYLEIRPCVEFGDGITESFLGEPQWCGTIGGLIHTPKAAFAEALWHSEKYGGKRVFWSVYGRDSKGHASVIGDFSSFEAALDVQRKITAVMWASYRAIEQGEAGHACILLEDFMNQCSNEDRL